MPYCLSFPLRLSTYPKGQIWAHWERGLSVSAASLICSSYSSSSYSAMTFSHLRRIERQLLSQWPCMIQHATHQSYISSLSRPSSPSCGMAKASEPQQNGAQVAIRVRSGGGRTSYLRTSRSHERQSDFLVRNLRLHALDQWRKFVAINLAGMVLCWTRSSQRWVNQQSETSVPTKLLSPALLSAQQETAKDGTVTSSYA